MAAKLKVVDRKPELLVERFESNDHAERLDQLSRESGVLFHALLGLLQVSHDHALQGMADIASRIRQGIDLLADEVRS